MGQLLRQAARSLLRNPSFTLLIVIIMALCIGGNASVYAIARAILFQDLPYQDGDRLVILSLIHRPTGTENNDLSYAEAQDWRSRLKSLEELAPFLGWNDRLLIKEDGIERLIVNYVAPAYLRQLGAKAKLGRLFNENEEGLPDSSPVVVLSHNLWQQQFSGDPGVLGQPMQLNDHSYTIIGVMSPDFVDFAEREWGYDIWLPAVMAGRAFGDPALVYEERTARYWSSLGRIKEGVSLEEARQEVEAVALRMQEDFPAANRDMGARITPLREFVYVDLHPGMKLLLGGAILVLLIGCANVASLMTARMADRRSEMCTHLTLGASRRRVIQRVLYESLLLSVAGGVLGVLVAYLGTEILAGWLVVPPLTQISFDSGMVTIVLLVSVLTGVLFGLPPALGVLRLESRGALQQLRAEVGSRGHSSRGRTGLLVFQVALVTILLVVAGLLLRSFLQLRGTEVGFPTQRLVSLPMTFGAEEYSDRQKIVAAGSAVVERLEKTPGVEAVTVWGPGIPGLETQYLTLKREGATEDDPVVRGFGHIIAPGSLQALDLPLLHGREFTEFDTPDTPRVVIVSKSLANALWPGEDAIGKRIQWPGRPNEPMMEIVGVIPNSKLHGRFTDGTNQIILSHAQRPMTRTTLMVRTAADPNAMIDRIRSEVRAVDPNIPLFDIRTIQSRLDHEEGSHKLNAAIVSMYSILSLTFAVLGLYGILAYSVIQRTREIGVRIALGARPREILSMIMGRGLTLVGSGVLLGIVVAAGLTRLLSNLLYGVEEKDPLTFAVVVVTFALVAVLATFLPARRAMKVEPSMALRFE